MRGRSEPRIIGTLSTVLCLLIVQNFLQAAASYGDKQTEADRPGYADAIIYFGEQ